MFGHEKGDVATDQIAEQAGFVRLYFNIGLEIGTMPDAAARR
jgi:hypothetical protein